MGALRFFWMTTLINISALLAGSFFVLFANRKVHEGWLKIFGYVVAGVLCLAAAAVLISGIIISLKT